MAMTMRLGLRNLARRPFRTALTVGMLVVGTTLSVLTTGLNEGTYADMIRMATGLWSGHAQLHHQDYHGSPSLHEAVDEPLAWIDRLERSPQVQAVTARVETSGLLSAQARTASAQLVGVLPEREARVSSLLGQSLAQRLVGSASAGKPIVLGADLARRLRVAPGQEVIFMGQGADGSIAADAFEVVGLLESGVSALDASMALIRLEDAQELLTLPDKAHMVVVRMRQLEQVDGLAGWVQAPAPLRLSSWRELTPELERSIQSDRQGGAVFLAILVFVVILGVINTSLMAVFERTPELGVMRALGASPGHLLAVILWESGALAFVGVATGALLGASLVEQLGHQGVAFFDQPVEFAGMTIGVIYPVNTWLGTALYPALIFAAALLGGLWPAWRATRVEPTQALRG